MALINCPECGKQISDRAPACPQCGCPISGAAPSAAPDRSAEIEKFLDLAVKGIQGQNSDQVEKYCQSALEIDPQNAKAWELEARGILFASTLKDNKIPQAISAANNAVCFTAENKEELAVSLYDAISVHINGLLSIAINRMPVAFAPQYVAQCMGYYQLLLTGISNLPKSKIEAELKMFDEMDAESKKAIMPKKRMIYASHVMNPTWADQYRAALKSKGII